MHANYLYIYLKKLVKLKKKRFTLCCISHVMNVLELPIGELDQSGKNIDCVLLSTYSFRLINTSTLVLNKKLKE